MSIEKASMNAIELLKPGAEFNLVMTQHAMPEPSNNELLVAIEYVALNHLDARMARDGFTQWEYPHILGLDAVGTVMKAGKGVFPKAGSRVLFNANLAQKGMLKEFAVVPNHAVCELPDDIAPEVAVILPNAGMAALLAIEKLKLEEGDSLAINSAQGAVAHFAIQYAKQKGAQVFAFAQKQHHKRLRKLGADFAFDCESDNVCDQVKREIGAGGFDCMLNTPGGESFIEDLKHLRFCGRMACLNGFGHIPEDLLFEKAPNIGVVSIGGAWLANSLCAQQHLSFMGQKLLADVTSGQIKVPDIELIEFDADCVKEALASLLTSARQKRPVIKIEHK
ncbi:zinc-binding dehydrogenase [Pseudoalteromonas luteoviolacea]|uniref:zinc-binding dehydrogenase n=1 Tax=Pseudoalteromonas luteoviolacea TaxID=43657 RepID=UPI001B367E18|nr:zinc-binding dehydrogenase [Pseudoalteromonas luteoviolacea]MBQ4810834.1 zinc-binding dehydrogenase [Pseudoalteromonas luteoviolacea]